MRLTMALLLLALLACACSQRGDASPRPVVVFTAASTAEVIEEAARRFEADTGVRVIVVADASSRLAQQILAGGPADVFLSANQSWMNALEGKALIVPDSRADLLRNQLVLIVPKSQQLHVEFGSGAGFRAQCPTVERFAIGNPEHVPAGQYAKQALHTLGWWEEVSPMVIPAEDARAAVRLVEIGEADAGIVYATDARASNRIDIVAAIPAELHDPVTYPIARCSHSPDAAAFVSFLQSQAMRDVFESAGFGVVQSGSATED